MPFTTGACATLRRGALLVARQGYVMERHMPLATALRLVPARHARVWGGQRLAPGPQPIGEVWVVHEGNQVADGPLAGQTLAEVTARHGRDLLGPRLVEQCGPRFPLLVKLLDTADWLSLQVHPNDEQAVLLEGADGAGKTEAWHILEAEPDAQVIAGVRPGTTREALADAIQGGMILDLVQRLPARAGDTIFMAAGTIHALGPGLLLYEVQQTSDITYRVFDWDRPPSAGRALHIEKSLAVCDPALVGETVPLPALEDGIAVRLTSCSHFTLEMLHATHRPIALAPGNDSFHILTVAEGTARVAGDGWDERLERLETIVVPATVANYEIHPEGETRLLKASA